MRWQLTVLALFLTAVFASSGIAVDMQEDFENGFDDWEIYDEPGANDAPSNWQIASVGGQDTTLTPKSNIYGGPAGAYEPSRCSWAIYSKAEWASAVFEVSMYMTDNDIPGLLFRYVDPDNFYVFDLMQQARDIPPFKRLRKIVNGAYTELDIVHDNGYDQNVWYVVRIEYNGSKIKVFLDDELLFDVDDNESALPSGKIALSSWGMTDVFFDSVSISGSAAVEPDGKLSQLWGAIKATNH